MNTERISLLRVPGTNFVVLEGDQNIGKRALEEGDIRLEHELNNLEVVRSLGPSDVVWDVGAFIGETALVFAERGARVYGFEAQQDAYLAALNNTSSYCTEHHERITLYRVAVGVGEPVIVVDNALDGNLGTRTVQGSPDGIPALQLDFLRRAKNLPPPTFIKLDIEGSEAHALMGMQDTIHVYRPSLLIEVYPEMLERRDSCPESIYGALLDFGYGWEVVMGVESDPKWDILATPQ